MTAPRRAAFDHGKEEGGPNDGNGHCANRRARLYCDTLWRIETGPRTGAECPDTEGFAGMRSDAKADKTPPIGGRARERPAQPAPDSAVLRGRPGVPRSGALTEVVGRPPTH